MQYCRDLLTQLGIISQKKKKKKKKKQKRNNE